MPIHHSKQFFCNLACPFSELEPLGALVFLFFVVVAAKISPNKRRKERALCIITSVQFPLTVSQRALKQLMRTQGSLMTTFRVILGCLVHPFGVFT